MLRLDVITASDFIPAKTGFDSAIIHHPLDQIGCLGPTGATVGINWCGIGQYALHIHIYRRNIINAGKHVRSRFGWNKRPHIGEISAKIGKGLYFQADNLAIRVECGIDIADIVPTLGVAYEGFGTLRRVFYCPLQTAGGPGKKALFGIKKNLHAKPAANICGDAAQLVLVDFQNHFGEQRMDKARPLSGAVEGRAVSLRIIEADRATRFHRIHDDTVIDDLGLHNPRRTRECRIHRFQIAFLPIEANIVRDVIIKLRSARLGSTFGIRRGVQRRVINSDQFRRVPRLIKRFRYNHGNRRADMTHFVAFQNRARRAGAFAAVLVRRRSKTRQVAEPVFFHMLVCENCNNSRRCFRIDGINPVDRSTTVDPQRV